jgi:hypothetical protein
MSRQSRIGYEFLRCLNTVVGEATRDDVSFRGMPIGDLSYWGSRVGGNRAIFSSSSDRGNAVI